jgi:hypothetical protein
MALRKIRLNVTKIDKYIQKECKIFDKKTMKLGEYFLNNKIIKYGDHSSQIVEENHQPGEIGVAIYKQATAIEKPKLISQVNTSNNYSKINLADNIVDSNANQPVIELKISQNADEIAANNNFLKSNFNTSNRPENSIMPVIEEKENNNDSNNSDANLNKASPKSENSEIIIKEPTNRDYESLNLKERMIYDKRTFKHFLIESIIEEHRIINIILESSILHPFYIKLNKLVFELSMGLAINALMYTADYIDTRATANDKVKYKYLI